MTQQLLAESLAFNTLMDLLKHQNVLIQLYTGCWITLVDREGDVEWTIYKRAPYARVAQIVYEGSDLDEMVAHAMELLA